MAYTAADARKDAFNQQAQSTINNAEANIKNAVARRETETIVTFSPETKEALATHLRTGGYTVKSREPRSIFSFLVKW